MKRLESDPGPGYARHRVRSSHDPVLCGTGTAFPLAQDVWYNWVALAMAGGFEEVKMWASAKEVGHEMARLYHG
jgi:hypothetical protein